MANLSGVNPNLTNADMATRRHDPIDDSLKIGTFSAITADANGTGIALKAEKIGPYSAVACYTFAGLATDANNFEIVIQGADNADYTNAVPLATVRCISGSVPQKAYLALEGAAVESLRKAAGEDETIYVRARAEETGDPTAALTATVYLTCD
jgi:hypothetical protein